MSQASLIYSMLYNNSTDKASWGSGPQHREFQYEIPQTKQVGVLE